MRFTAIMSPACLLLLLCASLPGSGEAIAQVTPAVPIVSVPSPVIKPVPFTSSARVSTAQLKDQRVILFLIVNGGEHGENTVVIRGKDILASVRVLESGGLRDFSGRRETIAGEKMVSLNSLAPGVEYQFDKPSLVLKIFARTRSLKPTNLNLAFAHPADLEFRDANGFFNYPSTMLGLNRWSRFSEGAFSYKGGLFYGNSRQIISPDDLSPELSPQGLSDYDYGIGLRRNDTKSGYPYGSVSLLGFHRYGLTDWLTVGGRLETIHDLVSGGPSVSAAVFGGEIDTSFAISRDRGIDGAAGSFAYHYKARRFSCGATIRYLSKQYSNLTIKSSSDRPLLQGQASLNVDLGYSGTLSGQYNFQSSIVQTTPHLISVNETSRLTDNLSFNIAVTRSLLGNSTVSNEILIVLSYFFVHDAG